MRAGNFVMVLLMRMGIDDSKKLVMVLLMRAIMGNRGKLMIVPLSRADTINSLERFGWC